MKPWNIKNVITEVNTKFGAPMGRYNKGERPNTITSGNNGRICKKHQIKVYTKRVNLVNGGYDEGGAYWGYGKPLYVSFTKDLNYIEFFRG